MEEFIFDDDVDEVGAEVEAHCPKCKADTAHVVVSKYEDEIRRVQCNPCGDVHAYRKPRGEDEEPEPEAKKKKAAKAKPTWEQVMAKSKKQPKPYNIADYFKELEILSHPKFGVGYVTENIGDDKIEVTFETDKRVLIHNRKNLTLPFLRPLTPPAGKKQKGGKAQPVKAAAAPAPAPAPKAKVSAAARPVAKKPAPPAQKAKPAAKAPAKQVAKPIAKKKAAPPSHKKPVKATARAAAKKPAKAKPIKTVKKSR